MSLNFVPTLCNDDFDCVLMFGSLQNSMPRPSPNDREGKEAIELDGGVE